MDGNSETVRMDIAKGTSAVIGSARNEFVIRSAMALAREGRDIVVISLEERAGEARASGFKTIGFTGHITTHNASFLKAVHQCHASELIAVVGEQYHHFNIFETLSSWMLLGLIDEAALLISQPLAPTELDPWWGKNPAIARLGHGDISLIEQVGPVPPEAYLVYDSLLGWRNRQVDLTAMASSGIGVPFSPWRLRINADGTRAPSASAPSGDAPVIAFYGGSETFGAGLSDEETCPGRLQSHLPSFSVINSGVHGYSDDQALALMEITISLHRPAVTVFSPQNGGTGDKRNLVIAKANTLCENHGAKLVVADLRGILAAPGTTSVNDAERSLQALAKTILDSLRPDGTRS